ncbi:MAG: hypothetical protein SOT13_01775 [Candidatus Aphodousia sp.]|nr:hypothetical protein [Candidatus Aphodousia sp.]
MQQRISEHCYTAENEPMIDNRHKKVKMSPHQSFKQLCLAWQGHGEVVSQRILIPLFLVRFQVPPPLRIPFLRV